MQAVQFTFRKISLKRRKIVAKHHRCVVEDKLQLRLLKHERTNQMVLTKKGSIKQTKCAGFKCIFKDGIQGNDWFPHNPAISV